jgi:MFS family permease
VSVETVIAAVESAQSRPRRLLVFGAVQLGMLMSTLDQSIVGVALPNVVHDLGGIDHFAWVFTGYGLTLSITTTVDGKLGDLFGHRTVYLCGVITFIAGSMLCGVSGYDPDDRVPDSPGDRRGRAGRAEHDEPDCLRARQASDTVRHGFTEAYANSLDGVFFIAVPILLAALILSLGMRDRKLGE